MTTWVAFQKNSNSGFGTLENNEISVYEGDLFGAKKLTNKILALDEVTLQIPCTPTKMFGLWNNFHATAEKTGLPHPEHPWYFVMTPNTFAAANTTIRKPSICSGKIVFEAELGIVIGKTCKEVAVSDIEDYIFGYTCVNDVTAPEYLFNEEKFAHWTRSKCFDGFGIFGPGIATDIKPDDLVIKAFLEGDGQVQERQNYPVSDMIYSPLEIVSKMSYDMKLNPGDIIACGTSLGAGALKEGWKVTIDIEGVGQLVNSYSET